MRIDNVGRKPDQESGGADADRELLRWVKDWHGITKEAHRAVRTFFLVDPQSNALDQLLPYALVGDVGVFKRIGKQDQPNKLSYTKFVLFAYAIRCYAEQRAELTNASPPDWYEQAQAVGRELLWVGIAGSDSITSARANVVQTRHAQHLRALVASLAQAIGLYDMTIPEERGLIESVKMFFLVFMRHIVKHLEPAIVITEYRGVFLLYLGRWCPRALIISKPAALATAALIAAGVSLGGWLVCTPSEVHLPAVAEQLGNVSDTSKQDPVTPVKGNESLDDGHASMHRRAAASHGTTDVASAVRWDMKGLDTGTGVVTINVLDESPHEMRRELFRQRSETEKIAEGLTFGQGEGATVWVARMRHRRRAIFTSEAGCESRRHHLEDIDMQSADAASVPFPDEPCVRYSMTWGRAEGDSEGAQVRCRCPYFNYFENDDVLYMNTLCTITAGAEPIILQRSNIYVNGMAVGRGYARLRISGPSWLDRLSRPTQQPRRYYTQAYYNDDIRVLVAPGKDFSDGIAVFGPPNGLPDRRDGWVMFGGVRQVPDAVNVFRERYTKIAITLRAYVDATKLTGEPIGIGPREFYCEALFSADSPIGE